MKNYDKILAKYATQLENPKYYEKMINTIHKAESLNYKWKMFNEYDLGKIVGELVSYYDAIKTDEEHKRMVKHCNTNWFIISDKNLILWETDNTLKAMITFLQSNLLLLYVKIKRKLVTDRLICTDNVDKKIYLVRGALNVAKVLDCSFWDMDEKCIN